MKLETIAQAMARHRRDGRRPPAITFPEMAQECGVPPRTLMGLMSHYPGAPKPVPHLGRGCYQNKWYEAAAFRAWWKTVPRK